MKIAKLLKLIKVLFVVVLLSSCAQKYNEPIQENLLSDCSTDVSEIKVGNGEELMSVLLEYDKLLITCAKKHQDLVRTIRK